MVDTLSTFTQAMALLPDNTSRLINPSAHRSALISLLDDRGAAFADPTQAPFTIPIPAVDTWVDIPLAISAAMVESPAVLFWRMDANGHLVYDYEADWPTITVPPGHIRAARLLAVIGLDPGTDIWEFAFTLGGAIQEPTWIIDTATATDAITVTLIAGQGVDVSLAPPVSVSVRNLNDASDLTMLAFNMSTTGGPLV